MKKFFIGMLMLSSFSTFAVVDGSYDCKIAKNLSVKTYEAGDEFTLLVSGNSLTISGKDISSCSSKAANTSSDFIKADNAMKDCGLDGIDLLVPIEMKEQVKKSAVVVVANGSFDIYQCNLAALIQW